jgi:hypothetical protein
MYEFAKSMAIGLTPVVLVEPCCGGIIFLLRRISYLVRRAL